ncbi:SH3 domain-containing protein [Romboutsia lituseburensis]|uniref:SH3 domain protein n=1 Tax=Romboutsia lituseburensis DSM 797 TaxID=1121325 RepID=A0A1G9K8N0_9FIRM|nr:SH3 domain-containing protein [Romboutsia lituseburensis]CEH34811.1 3D domain protein [Romboutsia lituseburensis]SDL46107.1 SH3 domain protein [Romboutsia lituseburensis DSM 797]
MRKNKNIKKSLILTIGLAVGGLYTSTHTVHAVERQVVRTETLNVRKAPSVEESKVEILDKGTVVEILEKNKEWNKIKIDGNEGWIHSDYTSNEKAKATVDKLNVRKGPSIKDSKIEFLSKGTDVEILEVEDDWYKIKYDDKKTGWVNEEYILTETQVRQLQKEASVAKKSVAKNNNAVVSNNNVNSNEVASNNSQNNNEEDKTTSSNNNTGRSMTVNASAYSGHTITATGTTPKWGTIAVDPSVIPYGTRVYIPKFNMVFIAEDCGGAIKGNKIDIFMNSESDCNSFGRQNIEIQILG